MLQGAKLIQNAAQRPYVWRIGVRLRLTNLGRHIVRRSLYWEGKVNHTRQDRRYSKIAQLNRIILGQEDILWLKITMQYFSTVNILQGKTNLHKPLHDRLFCEILFFLGHFLDMIGQISH